MTSVQMKIDQHTTDYWYVAGGPKDNDFGKVSGAQCTIKYSSIGLFTILLVGS